MGDRFDDLAREIVREDRLGLETINPDLSPPDARYAHHCTEMALRDAIITALRDQHTRGTAMGERLMPVPADQWTPVVGERVLIFVVHPNAKYAKTDELADWQGWFEASWTTHNQGGWVWHGMLGQITHVAPLPPPPGDGNG